MQPEPELPATISPKRLKVPIRLCDTTPTDVVPAEHYVEELWAALDQTLQHSGCGLGSDTPIDLDMKTLEIKGAPAPVREVAPDPTVPCHPSPGIPDPPKYENEGCSHYQEHHTGSFT